MPNRIRLSSEREPPEAILQGLRRIDPLYDLHYLGDGRWAVGRVVPNSSRRTIGMKMKHNIMRNPNLARQKQRLRIAELAMQGFGVVGFYKFAGEPTDQIVQDVQDKEYHFQNAAEATFNKHLEEAEIHGGVSDELLEEIEYRERHVGPELFRDRKHFDQGGHQ